LATATSLVMYYIIIVIIKVKNFIAFALVTTRGIVVAWLFKIIEVGELAFVVVVAFEVLKVGLGLWFMLGLFMAVGVVAVGGLLSRTRKGL